MATLIKKPILFLWALLFSSTIFAPFVVGAANESTTVAPPSYVIDSINLAQTTTDYVLEISGGAPPTYTMYELFNPYRVIVDIADASLNSSVDLAKNIAQGPITQVKAQILDDQDPPIARIEIYLSDENSFTIDRLNNDIFVKFAKSQTDQQPLQENAASQPVEQADAENPLNALVDYSAELQAEQNEPETPAEEITPEPAPIASTISPFSPADVEETDDTRVATKKASLLLDIEVEYTPAETKVYLKANGPISDFKKVHLAKNLKVNRPDRMYLDIKDVQLAGPIPPKDVSTALAQIRTGSRSDGFRVVFDSGLDDLFSYEITEQPDGLLVTINEPSPATAVIADLMAEEDIEQSAPAPSPLPEIISPDFVERTIDDKAAEPDFATDDETIEDNTKPTPATGSDLSFAGYTKQRITVDFYKIDLHNVFRLFGEISNLNMVVDEAVGGSLTLALNDVPWDFAMEIILNLKDLQKEERFNTIVISPKSKNFEWPKQALSNVEFKADNNLDVKEQEEEAIKIISRQEVPETVVMAKNLIYQAQESEKLGNFTSALSFYEDAYKKWPENTIIAKRISAICLVHLGQNAKAVHYSKLALQANPTDYQSALQAAIGLARMKKSAEAKKFFEKSISGTKPSSEALSSYAAFSEENQDYDHALLLLKQHEDFHGDSLATMISRARIHDKQGMTELANSEYQTILLSGYEIPADLSRYIKGRASLANH